MHVMGRGIYFYVISVTRMIHKPYFSPTNKGIKSVIHFLSSLDAAVCSQNVLPCSERSGCHLNFVSGCVTFRSLSHVFRRETF